MQALALKYRPHTFEDVVEQDNIKIILKQQLESNDVKNSYLFCGPAGDGKTTCARIFANEINKGQGNPIEMDAASNSGVADVEAICKQAQSKSLNSEYKVFIIDECHSISNAGWQAFLKTIEEPPAKSIFIFCTTDPQKIPKTIISRVERHDFRMISLQGITDRLVYVCDREQLTLVRLEALEFIAKLADGHMRDALTMLDKCIAYSTDITLENVVKCLGTINYNTMFDLTELIQCGKIKKAVDIIEEIYNTGKDIKLFLKQYIQFLLDICKLRIGCDWNHVSIPRLTGYENRVDNIADVRLILSLMLNVNSSIKYSTAPKYDIEVALFDYYGRTRNTEEDV